MSSTNALGIKLVSDNLKGLVGNDPPDIGTIDLAKIKSSLSKFDWDVPLPPSDNDSLEIPELHKLVDGTAYDFISRAGDSEFGAIKSGLIRFLTGTSLPERPNHTEVAISPRWTRYEKQGDAQVASSVDYPLEGIILVDVETLVKLGGFPVMAACVTEKAWYIWLHPSLMPTATGEFKPEMISVGQNKLIVNFATKFDTGRFKETYWLDNNNWAFDLQSCHIATCGMSSKQRDLHTAWRAGKARFDQRWFTETSPNSLLDCYNLHVKPRFPLQPEAKEIRNIFVVAEGPKVIRDNLPRLIEYNLDDISYTWELGKYLLPKYFHSNPSIATFAGHLISNRALLPVETDWKEWAAKTDRLWAKKIDELEQMVTRIAKDYYKRFMEGDLSIGDIESDPWLNKIDWTPAKTGATKGQPAWWRKAKGRVTTRSRITPYLLGLKIHGDPIVYLNGKAWCHPVDSPRPGSFTLADEKHPTGNGGEFMRLPHKKGSTQNVGNPLGKDYISAFEDGVMTARDEEASEFMRLAANLTYWTAIRKRVHEQITWPLEGTNMLAIEPQVMVHGTCSRRWVERLWLTLSGAGYENVNPRWILGAKGDEELPKGARTKLYPKVGSETMGKVRAPEGYVIVLADFDQQEMKAASGYADAFNYPAVYGSTPMGITTVTGTKSKGTDNHTLLASSLGIIRDIAKILNFQMLYMCGVKALVAAIKSVRADWDQQYCESIAKKALKMRRGSKDRSSGRFRGGTDSAAYNFMQTLGNAKVMPGHLRHLQATEKLPRTPLCSSAMSHTITAKLCGNDYMTSRANWGIQSSGSDLLHCLLLVVHHLSKRFQVPMRFMVARHDEAAFLVAEGLAKEGAAIMQLASLIVWSAFFGRLGFHSLPESYAWFSAVNIDTCLRKEVYYSQATVSQPVDVAEGYNLGPAECIDALNGMLAGIP